MTAARSKSDVTTAMATHTAQLRNRLSYAACDAVLCRKLATSCVVTGSVIGLVIIDELIYPGPAVPAMTSTVPGIQRRAISLTERSAQKKPPVIEGSPSMRKV